MEKKTMKREKWLDAIKGIACIVVFFSHFYLTFCSESVLLNRVLSIKPLQILVNGNYAVCLFLMISAYVISVPVYTCHSLDRIRQTAFKRYLRLMLPVFFASALSFILSRTVGYYNLQAADLLNNPWLKEFFTQKLTAADLLHSSLIGVWWQGDNSFNGPFWMLRTLFLGTFLVIILAVITSGEKTKKAYAGGVLALMLCVYLEVNVYDGCLVFGTLLAFLKCRTNLFEPRRRKKGSKYLTVFLLGASLFLPSFQNELTSFFSKYEIFPAYFSDPAFYNGSAGFLLLFSLMGLPGIQNRLGSSRSLDRISRISFSVYLLHWPVICSFSCWFYVRFGADATGAFPVVLFLLTAAMVTAASKIFYELIEKKLCAGITDKLCSLYLQTPPDGSV